MKRLNFNQLKNVKTPDDWVEKALDIPETAKKERGGVFPFLSKTKYIAAAASVVLCCALGVFLFATFDREGYVIPLSSNENTDMGKSSTTTPNDENKDEDCSSNNDCTGADNQTTLNSSLPSNYFDFSRNNIFSLSPTTNLLTSQYRTIIKGLKNSEDISVIIPHIYDDNSHIYNYSEATRETDYVYSTQSTIVPTATTKQNITTNHPTSTQVTKPATVTKSSELTQPISSWVGFATEPGDIVPGAGVTNDFSSVSQEGDSFTSVIRLYPKTDTRFNIHGSISCHIESISGAAYSEKYSQEELCDHTSGTVEYCPVKKIGYLERGEYRVTFYDNFGNSVTKTCWLMDGDCAFYE